MYEIDLRRTKYAETRLSEQMASLKAIEDELYHTESRLREMSFAEDACAVLHKIRKELGEECVSFRNMIECMEGINEICEKTENRIADVYDLEYILYPKTIFGESKLAGLEKFRDLLIFDTDRR